MQTIKSFEQILDHIALNSLVICDLDNTLFNYKSRCAIKTDKLIVGCGTDNQCVEKLVPSITDINGFALLCIYLKFYNSKLIFLTARDFKQYESTDIILKHYNLDQYDVLYSGSQPKGKFLIENMDKLNSYNKIIFIDDLEENLNSVYYTISHTYPDIKLLNYKFLLT